MKVTADCKTLLAKMAMIEKIIPKKGHSPMVDKLLFAVNDGKARLTAYDLDNGMETTFEVENDGEGAFAVYFKDFKKALQGFKKGELTLTFTDAAVNIEKDGVQATLPVTDDFPGLDFNTNGKEFIEISGEFLQAAIDKLKVFVAKDETKPAMEGICFELIGGRLRCVATDMHKIAYLETQILTEKEFRFILPVLGLTQLAAHNIENRRR